MRHPVPVCTHAHENLLIAQKTNRTIAMVAGLGFEPRLTGPDPAVLPLHHPAICSGYFLADGSRCQEHHEKRRGS